MTKNLLIVSIFFLSAWKLSAQCTPDNMISSPGFYPKSLPDAALNQAYSQVIQFKIVKDTTVVFAGNTLPATVDSAIVLNIKGMPKGVSSQLNKTRPVYTPAEVGCVLVSGTPTVAGTFKLKIAIRFFAKVSGFAVDQVDTVKSFAIIVKDPNASVRKLEMTDMAFYPNPFTEDRLYLKPSILKPGTRVYIINNLGQVLLTKELDGTETYINFNYPKGLYWVKLETGTEIGGIKLIKN